jgi:choline-sulfatase
MAGPNLLFILSDQHTCKVTGCYGDPLIATPNLDRLAADGIAYDNAYCPSPICTPSRMAMLTACHPHTQDCWTNDDFLASDRPTMAHALGAAGLAPTLIGRMHSMGPDQLHGYVVREIGDHSPNWIGVPRHDMGVLANTNDPGRNSVVKSGPGQMSYELKDLDVAEAAEAWLRAAPRDRPFALTVGLMLPHPPYVAQPEDFSRYANRVGLPLLPRPSEEHPWLAWWRENRGINEVDPADVIAARAAYYGLVTSMDRMIGRILAALDETGMAADTLVVYASDHGDQLGDRGLWWKHTFYDESAKVPLLMRWPGRLPRGERRGQVVNLIDLTATMLDAMAAPPLPDAEGRSFLGVARDATSPWLDETFSEYCTDAVPDWTGGMAVQQRMIRTGRWKLVHYNGYRPQLFDLQDDPHELHDLAENPRHAVLREQLLARVTADWDGGTVARRMAKRRRDKDLLGAWARKTAPPSTYLWPVQPEQNRLDRQPGNRRKK